MKIVKATAKQQGEESTNSSHFLSSGLTTLFFQIGDLNEPKTRERKTGTDC